MAKYDMFYIRRWGLRIGRLTITWYSLFEQKPIFEVVWYIDKVFGRKKILIDI